MTNTESKIFDTSQVAFDIIIQMAPKPLSVLFYFVPQEKLARGHRSKKIGGQHLMEKPFAANAFQL